MPAPSPASRPRPSLMRSDDLGRVLRVVGHEQPGGRLLVPAEAGDAVVVAVQDAALAGRCRRRQHRDPRVERGLAAAHQAAEDRHPPGADRLAQDGQAQPIDLDHQEPRLRLLRVSELPRHEAPDEHAVVGVVVADGHELREQAVEHGQEQAPQTAAAVSPTWIAGQDSPKDDDRPELGDQAQEPGRRRSAVRRAARGAPRQGRCRGPGGAGRPAAAGRARRPGGPGRRRP